MTKSYKPGKTVISVKPIVFGGLYKFRGAIIRARRRCNNGLIYISMHKMLHGFAHENELQPISKQEVEEYLKEA